MKIKGIVIWGHSNCRSVMGLYRELIRASGLPAIIPLWRVPKDATCFNTVRQGTGFRSDEFSDLPMMGAGDDYATCRRILDEHRDWLQLFCDYQLSAVRRRLILEAKAMGCVVGILNEAPCNMETGFRALAKLFFMRFVLPRKIGKQIKAADFFVNYSGDDDKYLKWVGWPQDKIIPLGYFPPPIEGSKCVARARRPRPFMILATGILAKYRGADVLVRALKILKNRGIDYRATITQDGELLPLLKSEATKYDLPIDFPGFLPMPKLIEHYETCSVYVGAGRHEPWGMRLNDALNCGAPLIVSRGMGGVKLVDDYKCGLSFASGDVKGLADALERMATDDVLYAKCAFQAKLAADEISPRVQAERLWQAILKYIKL